MTFSLLCETDAGQLHSQDPIFPSTLKGWHGICDLELGVDETHFGFIHQGCIELRCASGKFQLSSGMYFRAPGEAQLVSASSSSGFVASRGNEADRDLGFFQLGGPVEEQGRLEYIDGCSDTLLISPVVYGAPCLNLLFLPPRTEQTAHTHPSCRMGMIIGGGGVCNTPTGEYALVAGMKFLIEAEAEHSFHTSDEALRVIAWHPDSDHGPTHEDHPMVNRTIIEGVSASELRKSGQIQWKPGG